MERYGLTLSAAPSSDPVSVSEAKAHLRVEHSSDDTLIGGLITAAREYVESHYSRTLVTSTWALTLPEFPTWEVRLPRGPLQSVASVAYVDAAGDAQTLAAARYLVDATADPGTLTPAWGYAWPATRAQEKAVTITYLAGYGTAANVPGRVKLAVKMLVSHWYENRDAAGAVTLSAAPLGVDSLLMAVWPGVYS